MFRVVGQLDEQPEKKNKLSTVEYAVSQTNLEYELEPGKRSIIKLRNDKNREDDTNHQLVVVEWLPILEPDQTQKLRCYKYSSTEAGNLVCTEKNELET